MSLYKPSNHTEYFRADNQPLRINHSLPSSISRAKKNLYLLAKNGISNDKSTATILRNSILVLYSRKFYSLDDTILTFCCNLAFNVDDLTTASTVIRFISKMPPEIQIGFDNLRHYFSLQMSSNKDQSYALLDSLLYTECSFYKLAAADFFNFNPRLFISEDIFGFLSSKLEDDTQLIVFLNKILDKLPVEVEDQFDNIALIICSQLPRFIDFSPNVLFSLLVKMFPICLDTILTTVFAPSIVPIIISKKMDQYPIDSIQSIAVFLFLLSYEMDSSYRVYASLLFSWVMDFLQEHILNENNESREGDDLTENYEDNEVFNAEDEAIEGNELENIEENELSNIEDILSEEPQTSNQAFLIMEFLWGTIAYLLVNSKCYTQVSDRFLVRLSQELEFGTFRSRKTAFLILHHVRKTIIESEYDVDSDYEEDEEINEE